MENMEKYYCVFCGEEIKPEERGNKLMISLSPVVLDGASESMIKNTPIYITKRELETFINRTDQNGRHFLYLHEVFTAAFRQSNIGQLIKHSKEEDDFFDEAEYQKDPEAFINSVINQYNAGSEKLPGFDNAAVSQLRTNFPNGVCYVDWKLDEKNGYGYRLTQKIGAPEKTTRNWVCACCKEQVLEEAFQYRHILVGFLGFRSAGKTCLIGSICHLFGGYLQLPDRYRVDYYEQLEDYANGYSMSKTEYTSTNNTFHPSLVKDETLWTFVDIPGEKFYDENEQEIDINGLKEVPDFQMLLKCHSYILTMDQVSARNQLLRNKILSIFTRFIGYADQNNIRNLRGMPVVFALTKVDAAEEDEYYGSMVGLDKYPKKYRKELFVVRNKGLQSFLEDLSNNHYLFPVSCAPYGFPPCPADDPKNNVFSTTNHKKDWKAKYIAEQKKKYKEEYLTTHEGVKESEIPDLMIQDADIPHAVYKPANPRNVDLIIEWLKKLHGVVGYAERGEFWQPRDISTVNRFELHDDSDYDLLRRIMCMFFNPSEYDLKFDSIMGESALIRRVNSIKLRRQWDRGRIER